MFTENGITFSKVILAAGRSDLRKGIDGLAAMVRLKYGLDPLEKGTLFLFCGVRRDRVKGLLWAGDRFILLYIRLADGRFFHRPLCRPQADCLCKRPPQRRKR